jgi:uncharacterized UBP type Zn finger protein
MKNEPCEHLEEYASAHEAPVIPRSEGCEECLRQGSRWVQLRLCLECGHVGCCDSSPGRHATAHFKQTGHPLMRAYEPGETWSWCYLDEAMLEDLPVQQGETPEHHLSPP